MHLYLAGLDPCVQVGRIDQSAIAVKDAGIPVDKWVLAFSEHDRLFRAVS